MANIIDCKAIASSIKEEARITATVLRSHSCIPTIVVIQVGNDPASNIYIRNKQKACEQCGIQFLHQHFPITISREELKKHILDLNESSSVHAVMVQCPLPEHLRDCPQYIHPSKDVDGITASSQACLMLDKPFYPVPCTARGIEDALISAYGKRSLCGEHAVIIGRSSIVGKPTALRLLSRNCTVTICHSHTKNLSAITRQADILISAVGKESFVTANMVKPNATVIDVGINRLSNGKVVGDVTFDEVEPIAGAITTVPGGIGTLTVANLVRNVVELAYIQCKSANNIHEGDATSIK